MRADSKECSMDYRALSQLLFPHVTETIAEPVPVLTD